MGRTIIAIAAQHGVEEVFPVGAGDDPAAVIGECDAVIDFSRPAATLALVKLAAEANKPAIIGTTGHTPEQRQEVRSAAASIPVGRLP